MIFLCIIVFTLVKSDSTYYGYDGCRNRQAGNTYYDFRYYPTSGININTSNTNSNYQYFYSPCNLSFYKPEEDTHYAIKRYNIKEETIQYFVPNLEKVSKSKDTNQDIPTWRWRYEYANDSCPDQIQIVDVYWQCNGSIVNDPYYYHIVSAGSLFECYDSIFLQSPFACNDSAVVYPQYNYPCVFTSNDNTINIDTYITSSSHAMQIEGTYKNYYYYSPCRNVLKGSSGRFNWGLILQVESVSANGYAWDEAKTIFSTWDIFEVIEPYYDPIKNIWTFEYIAYNIDSDHWGNCSTYKTYVLWGCDCVKEQTTERIFNDECSMTLNITRKDLCIDYINQCFPDKNNTDCVYYWRQSTSHPYEVFNLSFLTNKQIGGIEDGGLYAFIYTPCNNNFLCDDNEDNDKVMSMAGRLNINQEQCFEYLAIFNGTNSFIVDYNQYPVNTWTIQYLNGAFCETDITDYVKFTVKWECKTNIEYRVDSINFNQDTCNYQVTISSQYACT